LTSAGRRSCEVHTAGTGPLQKLVDELGGYKMAVLDVSVCS